jgi:hypothetical protein
MSSPYPAGLNVITSDPNARPIMFEGRWIQPHEKLYKELIKFEQDGRDGRPNSSTDAFRMAHQYPKMLYKAGKRRDGVIDIAERDMGTDHCPNAIANFANRCQRKCGAQFDLWVAEFGTVIALERAHNEEEQLKKDGWFEKAQDAKDWYITHVEHAKSAAAAHREYEDRGLSEAAKREIQMAQDETPEQLAEVPEKPKARRGRPKKVQSEPIGQA